MNVIALQTIRAGSCLGYDVAAFNFDRRAQSLHALQVQVYRAGSKVAATWQRHPGFPKPSQEWAQHIDRRPHLLDMLVGGFGTGDVSGIQEQRVLIQLGMYAQRTQQPAEGPHIAVIRRVAQVKHTRCQQAGWHQGKRGVFGAGDRNGSL